MSNGYFITGTDTDVGKTVVALALIKALQNKGLAVAGMKPVSAGCRLVDKQLCNDDACELQQASSVKIPYEIINPYAFEPAVAPHLAAQDLGLKIEINQIRSSHQTIAAQVNCVIVEGAGGWLVPLDDHHTMADMVVALQIPVILVVGLRLGCLNHALLTMESIHAHGTKLSGWVINELDATMAHKQQNIETLQQHIDAPLLGVIPYQKKISIDEMAAQLDVNPLM